MSDATHPWSQWRAAALRDKYRPRTRLAHSFLMAAPWLNVALACALFVWVGGRITLQPGVVFDLPAAPFQEGLYETATAVMLPIGGNGGTMQTLVFFDDERYSLSDDQQLRLLGEALRGMLAHTLRRDLLLLADRRVPHGDVIRAVNLARAAGVQRVNVGLKPE